MWVLTRWFGSRRLRMAGGWRNKPDITFAKGLIEAGEYWPVIDSRYPMGQVVEAHRRVETWQKTGNVVLVIRGDAEESGAATPAV